MGSKLSRKGNVGAGVGAKWGVHDIPVVYWIWVAYVDKGPEKGGRSGDTLRGTTLRRGFLQTNCPNSIDPTPCRFSRLGREVSIGIPDSTLSRNLPHSQEDYEVRQ